MKVSVVIPNFNGRKLLEKNLPSVLGAFKNKVNNIIEIIVVDDGSTDDSISFLKKNYTDIKLIKHTKNRGFSKAVNTGVRSSKGDLILLLNNDVKPSRDFLKSVVAHFDDKKVFAVSLHEQGYGYAVGYFENGYIQIGMGKEDSNVHDSFYVSGGSGIFRKSIWKELSGMDETLLSPFYWEDIDICYRALKRGYKCFWEPKAKVVHDHESTVLKLSKRKVLKIKERNHLLVIWKNLQSVSLLKKHISGIFKRIIKGPGYLMVVLMALSKISIVLKLRKKEIKESSVSDEVILARFTPTS